VIPLKTYIRKASNNSGQNQKENKNTMIKTSTSVKKDSSLDRNQSANSLQNFFKNKNSNKPITPLNQGNNVLKEKRNFKELNDLQKSLDIDFEAKLKAGHNTTRLNIKIPVNPSNKSSLYKKSVSNAASVSPNKLLESKEIEEEYKSRVNTMSARSSKNETLFQNANKSVSKDKSYSMSTGNKFSAIANIKKTTNGSSKFIY
jgi:hypothetical protein